MRRAVRVARTCTKTCQTEEGAHTSRLRQRPATGRVVTSSSPTETGHPLRYVSNLRVGPRNLDARPRWTRGYQTATRSGRSRIICMPHCTPRTPAHLASPARTSPDLCALRMPGSEVLSCTAFGHRPYRSLAQVVLGSDLPGFAPIPDREARSCRPYAPPISACGRGEEPPPRPADSPRSILLSHAFDRGLGDGSANDSARCAGNASRRGRGESESFERCARVARAGPTTAHTRSLSAACEQGGFAGVVRRQGHLAAIRWARAGRASGAGARICDEPRHGLHMYLVPLEVDEAPE